MVKIKKINAREILDSRGNPTIETKVFLDDGSIGLSSVPSGASRGSKEAVELRDNDPQRYNGLGVLNAVRNINETIANKLEGENPLDQQRIDKIMIELDGTKNKSMLGANAILSVSEAVCKAAALSKKIPIYLYINELKKFFGIPDSSLKIPIPIFNLINGGKHGNGNLDFQEFFVIPFSFENFSESLRIAVEIYYELKKFFQQNNIFFSIGDEGGFSPSLENNSEALEILSNITKNFFSTKEIFLGLDLAANSFYEKDLYFIKDNKTPLTNNGLIEYLIFLSNKYRLAIIEDPLYEDDFEGWQKITVLLGKKNILVVGDDLLCTNFERVKTAAGKRLCNGILIKPNQVGTISETLSVIKNCKIIGWKIVVSHRSGETNDDFIADFAVGVGADYVKFGAPVRGERVAKYNRLLEIEKELLL